jgi:hypothetical protein
MKAKGRLFSALVALALLLGLSGCGPTTSTPKKFMRSLFSGNATETLEYLCVDGGMDAIVAVRANWTDDVYKIVYQDDTSAQALVSGRLIISAENIEHYLPAVRDMLLQQGLDVPELPQAPQVGMGVQFGVKFDEFYMKYDDLRGKWCVDGSSYYNFLRYMYEMVVEEAGKLAP